MVTHNVGVQNDGGVWAGLQIPVMNLLPELARMRDGGVYWICTLADDDAVALAGRMLAQAPSHVKVAVVGDEDFSGLLDDAPPDQGPADTRFYQLEGRTWKALSTLADDLERTLRPRHRTVLVLVRAANLGQHALEDMITGWKAWLRPNGCTMLVLARGAEALALARHLTPMNEALSGLAVLDADQDASSIYRVMHWRSELGIKTALSMPLLRQPRGFKIDDSLQWQRQAGGLDEDRVFLDSGVLDGDVFIPPAEWHICQGWHEMRACGMAATDATLVFALNAQSNLTDLAQILHELRRARGRRMKLVVRAMQRAVRYQDEQLLLDCGATIVVPADVKPPGFLSLLEAVQGQVYARSLMMDIDRLAKRQDGLSRAGGVLPAEEFVRRLKHVLTQQETSAAPGVLVQLVPAQGLSARQALTQLRLRRGGDMACDAQGMVHLFLEDCRAAWVNTVIQQVFHLPVAELFTKYRVYEAAKDISWQADVLKDGLALETRSGLHDVHADDERFIEQAGASPRAATMPEPANTADPGRPRLRLMPLKLLEESTS